MGDLLVSFRPSERVKVRRYRVGDIARRANTSCPCGDPVTFEILGRKGRDYVKLAGALLRREEFDRVASMRPDLFDDYRAEVTKMPARDKVTGTITLRVFRRDGKWSESIRKEITELFTKHLFVTMHQTLGELIGGGALRALVVEPAGPFPEKYKDIKLSDITS